MEINVVSIIQIKRYPLIVILIVIFSLVFLFIIIYFSLWKVAKKDNCLKSPNKTIEMDALEEKISIQNYIDLVLNGTNIYKGKIYSFSNNPKISIVISVYNGEAYLRTALLSIQNQDLKDIEIIMVDDGSKDNSINLIKELKKTEPRIILLENGENRGPLYTKTKGVMHSKGKYVMIMDEDDIYVQKDAFSSLFYLCLKTWDINEPKVKFRTKIKNQDRNNRKCFGYLIFLEMLLELTKNTIKDKNIAFSQLDHWYLQKNICKTNKITKDKALQVFNLYLNSVYIRKENKKKIQDFINNKQHF